MLVTFRSKAHADIIMFDHVAISLLKLMGHSGAVPGALLAKDVPEALDRLKKAIEAAKTASASEPGTADDDSNERPVSLVHRALPLIDLLAASAQAKCDVMWDR